jgi:hypothetical protein
MLFLNVVENGSTSPPPPASIVAIIGKTSTFQIDRPGYIEGGGGGGGANTDDSKRRGFLYFDN